MASKHYVVKDRRTNALPVTSLTGFLALQREEEIARMLSGSTTEASLAHLHGAQRSSLDFQNHMDITMYLFGVKFLVSTYWASNGIIRPIEM